MADILYTQKWTDSNGQVRFYKDKEAREAIATLNADSSTSGSVDYKIAQALAYFGGFQVVASLDDVTDPDAYTIYLVKDSSVSGSDKYSEYIYVTNAFEMIGETSLDLSSYIQNTDYASASTAGVVKVDGTTIVIDSNGVISVQAAVEALTENEIDTIWNSVFS